MKNNKSIIWTEKYRPKKLSEFVFTNEKTERQANNWKNRNDIPNILIHGDPGNGKTTMARIIPIIFKVDMMDLLVINTSLENGIDLLRNKIERFITTITWNSPFKVIHLEEADNMSAKLMAALRAPMEDNAKTCKFILTTNNLSKISKPIQSRCTILNFDNVKVENIALRFEHILKCEEIDYDRAELLKIARETVPDIRKGISTLQERYDVEL